MIIFKKLKNRAPHHIKYSLLGFVINVIEMRVLVSHVAVKVELLELSESTEA